MLVFRFSTRILNTTVWRIAVLRRHTGQWYKLIMFNQHPARSPIRCHHLVTQDRSRIIKHIVAIEQNETHVGMLLAFSISSFATVSAVSCCPMVKVWYSRKQIQTDVFDAMTINRIWGKYGRFKTSISRQSHARNEENYLKTGPAPLKE